MPVNELCLTYSRNSSSTCSALQRDGVVQNHLIIHPQLHASSLLAFSAIPCVEGLDVLLQPHFAGGPENGPLMGH